MFMPKIENWDNELANNIPPLMSQVIDTSKLKDNLDLSNSEYTCMSKANAVIGFMISSKAPCIP